MPARLRRTFRSLAVVFAAFWIYRLLVAPWIDPSFDFAEQSGASEADLARAREADRQRLQKYARIFPPGSWELDEPIMIESEGVELLMKDYENLPGGQIKLSQCTMLYLAAGETDAHEPGRVIILRAPEGAVLRFDSDLNLRRGKVGKLKGGELKGPVTIHGTSSRPGADDELFVATRNVQMNERNIWSDEEVQFRYGPNHGDGRGLVIKLAPGDGEGGQLRGPNIGGFERIELVRDVRMTLVAGTAGLFAGDESSAAMSSTANTALGRDPNRESPVSISCRGPFYFDLKKRMASFRDQVEVVRMLTDGLADQSACNELQIFFGDKPTENAQLVAKPSSQSEAARDTNEQRLSLQVERLVALGTPATVDAPSNGVQVRANRLDYERARRRIVVEAAPSQPDASLKWNGSEYGGRSLIVERPNPKKLPLVTAKGAGWFDIADPDDPGVTLKAHWARELNMRPEEGSHRVSLVGGAKTKFAQIGELKARQIDLWLVEIDKPAQRAVAPRATNEAVAAAAKAKRNPASGDQLRNTVTPLRLLAVGNVQFDSPRLTGDAQHLDVHFDPAGTLRPTPPKSTASRDQSPPGLFPRETAAAENRVPQTAPGTSVPDASVNHAATARHEEAPQHFELHGNAIQARLVSQGEQTSVDFIEINGQVHLIETKSQQPSQRPIEIRGDWLQVQNAAAPQRTIVVVSGKPALIAARDMQMRGDTINLDRGRNLLWINGAGSMV
ncbi:MAG TPA: hypothetical protein VJ809_12665, partial [Pirellulales bacterium]|nr:hypothetical protein [Pirellulales bacterium]